MFGADMIFPEMSEDVNKSGTYTIFDSTRDLLRQTNDARAPGTEAKRVDYDRTTATYETEDHALDFVIPDETVKNNTTPINLFLRGSRTVDKKLRLNREIRAAAIMAAGVTNTSTPSVKWDVPATSDILGDVNTARQSVRDNTFGGEANMALMDRKVFDAIKNHPQVVGRIISGGRNEVPAQVFENAVAALFEVKKLVLVSGYKNTAEQGQATPVTTQIWSDSVYFWHQADNLSLEDPSFAYSLTWTPTRVFRGRDVWSEADRMRQGRRYVDKIVNAGAAYHLSSVLT
jgi:hypothetical protein